MGGDEGRVVEGGGHDQVLVGGARQRGLRHVAEAADQGVRGGPFKKTWRLFV